MAAFSRAADMDTPKTQKNQSQNPQNPNRVRDNQRRSRAQRKAYLEELQKRVQEYERRGTEASLQMQAAARVVTLENARLRMLLAQRGISEDEIQSFLRSFEAQDSPDCSSNGLNPPPNSAATAFSTAPSKRSLGENKLSVLANASTQQQEGSASAAVSSGQDPECKKDHDGPITDSAVSPLEMSCNAAARIIADMQGHGDDQLARAALGCRSPQDCMVKNVAVFRALEER